MIGNEELKRIRVEIEKKENKTIEEMVQYY